MNTVTRSIVQTTAMSDALAASLRQSYEQRLRGLAAAYYGSGLSCTARTMLTLYVVPLLGDAVQFVLVDLIQKARAAGGGSGDRRQLLNLGAMPV